ncbi:palindromic element RPE1 domain-containing protein [Rickettsia akari]|uniref:palindromic element RPE1 domain-containing protein n=1 Tax=Rickettsia akari TaxID=786 RepID=UPI0005A080B0|nr:palindromic element RPE1 domain-containing protein [Rickettsia akari]
MERLTLDFLYNVVNKEEFEGNTKHRTAAYTIVHKDEWIVLTYKLPLETSYAISLMLLARATRSVSYRGLTKISRKITKNTNNISILTRSHGQAMG